jgi:soluble lytic murein transglycosylase-like protein
LSKREASVKRRKRYRWLLLLPLAYVLVVNHTVRRFGGDPSLLSMTRLSEKTGALARLALHSVRHLWNDDCANTEPFVRAAARAAGIPESFAVSVARAESGFRSHSISSTGAMGVMQLMPRTAASFDVVDPFDPESNARGGTRYLASLWQRYRGDRMRVAAAYNAGERGVPRTGAMRVPSSTLSYAAHVTRLAKREHAQAATVVLSAPLVITASTD